MNLYTTSDALAQVTENGIGLGNIFNKLKIDIDSYEEIIKRFSELKLNRPKFKLDDGKANWDAIAKAIEGCDDTALSYFKTLDDGNGTINNQSASVEGLGTHLKATGQLFNFAAIKATLLNTALNAGIFLVASVAIQRIAKTLDNYIHRVEKSRERTNELFDEFRQMNDTLADHRKTVSELADRYDELSKGVSLSTNDNVSLSTEEYEEFLDINEQLAQSFPELAKGINENGNSILTLGTKGITAREQLEELLQAEEDLNNFRTAQGLDEALEGVYTYIEEANKAAGSVGLSIEETNKQLQELQDLRNVNIDLTSGESILLSGNSNNDIFLDHIERMKEAANDFYNSLDDDRKKQFSKQGIFDASQLFYIDEDFKTGKIKFYSDLTALSDEEINSLKGEINKTFDDINGYITEKTNELSDLKQVQQENEIAAQTVWADYLPQLVAGMKSQGSFKNLLDEDLQSLAVKIVEGFDYHVGNEIANYDGTVADFLREKIINPMTVLSDDDKQTITDAFTKLMTIDAEDVSKSNQAEITNLIGSIAGLLDKTPLEIRVALGFEVDEAAEDRYRETLTETKHKFSGYRHDDRGFEVNNDIGNWIDTLSLEELDLINGPAFAQSLARQIEGLDGAALSAENYSTALEEVKTQQNDISNETPVSLSFDDIIGKIENIAKPVMDAVQNAWAEAYNKDGVFEIDPSKALDSVSKIESAIDSVNKNEELGVNIDTSSLEALANVLSDTSSTADEVQQAYSNVTGALMDSLLPALQNMDDSQIGMVQSFMQSMGIMNAEELIVRQLGYSYSTYTAAKDAAANAGINLNADINTTIERLKEEKDVSDEDKQKIIEYMLVKASASGATIDVSAILASLGEECEWLKDAIGWWKQYKAIKGHGNQFGDTKLGVTGYTPVGSTGKTTSIKQNKVELPDVPKSISNGSAAKSARTETDALSSLNSEMDKLQSSYKSLCDIRDTCSQNGRITAAQYLNRHSAPRQNTG